MYYTFYSGQIVLVEFVCVQKSINEINKRLVNGFFVINFYRKAYNTISLAKIKNQFYIIITHTETNSSHDQIVKYFIHDTHTRFNLCDFIIAFLFTASCRIFSNNKI